MFNFATALGELNQDSLVILAAERRPPENYLFSTVLPEINRPTYTVETGTMTVKPTMAGAVGMDSPYPSGGYIEASQFLEQTAKFAIEVPLPERTTRELQAWLRTIGTDLASNRAIAEQALNFYDSVVLASLVDRDEWLRGQALCNGAISWQFNGIDVSIDYGVPAANKLPQRTIASTEAYHLAGTKFWEDVWEARRLLRSSSDYVAMIHSATLDQILSNTANEIRVASDVGGVFQLERYVTIGGNTLVSSDARDRVSLIVYDEEGESLTVGAAPTATKTSFMEEGKIVWVGSGNNTGFRVGQGSGGGDPTNRFEIGYTHMAPTVEGAGRPGRWGELYVPQDKPWQLNGRAAENSLPVIENPARLVIAETEMP